MYDAVAAGVTARRAGAATNRRSFHSNGIPFFQDLNVGSPRSDV
jgi:hypothetical protein